MWAEIALSAVGLALGAVVALRGVRAHRAIAVVVTASTVFALGARAWWQGRALGLEPRGETALPVRKRGAYAGSEACRACHPGEHASFMASFHRSMTERATPRTVRAPLPAIVRLPAPVGAWKLHVSADGRGATVTEDATGAESLVRITTGSHHYQAYWRDGARPGELKLLPFVYLLEEARFVPRSAVFLTPDDAPPNDLAWNASCIQCHSVAGAPERDDDGTRFESHVAELGIACEACHGPSAEHAERERDPARRYFGDPARPRPLNPAKLDAERSTGVCAQCHSLSFPRDEAAFWDHGVMTATPDRPWDTRTLLTYEGLADPRGPRIEAPRESLFWRDGTIRIGGREANGLYASACYLRGQGDRKIACTSCHAMHASASPDDQLARGKDEATRGGDGACTQCHDASKFGAAAHTHHATEGPGARCLGCHMPKTTFALLGAIRSHRIERPSLANADASGRIPVCNQCHLDKSIAWTSARMAEWYGEPRVRADDRGDDPPAAVRWLLAGDAAMRALAAAYAGSPEAQAASGKDWLAPLLVTRLDDSYAAVRFVAARSLRTLPGFDDLAYDFVAPPAERAAARKVAAARAATARALVPADVVRALSSQRDDRAITIAE